MPFKIIWDDFPEKYDDEINLQNLVFSPNLPKEIESHILIEADNYPAMKILSLKNEWKNSIDIIYIDPPYNTGNDFTYNDDFSQKNDKHSKWLSFMERRLNLAKNFLSESGCIFIAIDQSELYVLKILCDDIFGKNNFINDFMWLHGKGKKNTWSRTLQQHTLCYAKNKKKLKPFVEVEYSSWAKTNPDNDFRGNWFSGSVSFSEKRSNQNHKNYFTITSPSNKSWTRQWLVSREEMEKLLKENKIYWGKAPEFDKVPRVKIFNDNPTFVIPKNIIENVESTRSAQNHLDNLLGKKNIFDNPKPVNLISHLIKITNMKKDAIIMDFFAGSGTVFEAVCELNSCDDGNRKCILIQKPEKIKKSVQKNHNENSNSDFKTISDICRIRCKKVSEIYNSKIENYKLICK